MPHITSIVNAFSESVSKLADFELDKVDTSKFKVSRISSLFAAASHLIRVLDTQESKERNPHGDGSIYHYSGLVFKYHRREIFTIHRVREFPNRVLKISSAGNPVAPSRAILTSCRSSSMKLGPRSVC